MRRRTQYRRGLDAEQLPALIAMLLLIIDALVWWLYLGKPWVALGFCLAAFVPYHLAKWGGGR